MRGYIAQLEKQLTATLPANPTTTAKPVFVPVRDQLERLFASMPERQRQRLWTTRELAVMLKGEFRPHPSQARVAAGLRQLGFVQKRDYSNDGGALRYWHKPTTEKST